MPVEYTPQNPIEQFDFIIIDECHRSIYNLWKQVLDYYDAFLVGLTATPDKRTFGFFNENVVSEYTYEESVVDGVNVPYDVFTIETEITRAGAKIKAKEYVDKREKLTRKKRWEQLDEDPKSVLNRFRNAWAPRIAVTVDMIATGTDVKPLEVLLFMRDVKSANYFEQMKGRGTRTLNFDDLKRVTRTARHTKTHFVIVDAVGATKSKKTDSRPLERKPAVPLKGLLGAVAMGAQDEDLFTSLANRFIRLQKQLTEEEKDGFKALADGKSIHHAAKDLLDAFNPDTIENVHKVHEQIIDTVNSDTVEKAEWDSFSTDKAQQVVQDFTAYIETNKDEITALGIFYDQPYRRRELTFAMIKEVLEMLKREKPLLAPHYVWDVYARLEEVKDRSPKNELTALVSLIRRVTGVDGRLTPYNKIVDRNFKNWVFKKHSGAGEKFTEEQMDWLRMLKDHIATSFHAELDDLDYTPFDARGGRGRMWQLFGDQTNALFEELNEALAA